jgi:predicted dehydrogenase
MVDDFGIQLYGSEGGARIFAKQYALTDTLEVYGQMGDSTVDSKPRLVAREGHAQVIHRFVDSILHGTPMDPDGMEGLANIQLIDAIYKSADLGREVILEEEVAQISE